MLQQKNSTKKPKTEKISCVVCGEELTKYNIGMHVKKYHGLDPEEYKIEQGLKKRKSKRPICYVCNKNLAHYNSTDNVCSDEACKDYNNKKKKEKELHEKVNKTHEKYNEGNKSDWVECRVCGMRTGNLTQLHVRVHDMTMSEYSDMFPDAEIMSENNKRKVSERVKGKNNPAYGHGGKFSPFSKNFIKYKGEDYIDDVKRKASDSRTKNNSYHTRLEFYTAKGYSEDEARKMLSERQRTFTLKKCIEKHGEEEGTQVWEERQRKWQESIQSKSKDELDSINARKSSRINYSKLWGNEIDSPGLFYMVRVRENSYKIGVTTKDSVFKRYNYDIENKNIIFNDKTDDINHAFMIEQIIKTRFSHTILKRDYGKFGWTEVINDIEDIDKLSQTISELITDKDLTTQIFKKELLND